MSDELKPLGVIEPREWRNPEAEKRRQARDDMISRLLTLAVIGALLWWWAQSYGHVLISPRPVAARATVQCPASDVQLSAADYETQRRRCEAVAAGAEHQVRRDYDRSNPSASPTVP